MTSKQNQTFKMVPGPPEQRPHEIAHSEKPRATVPPSPNFPKVNATIKSEATNHDVPSCSRVSTQNSIVGEMASTGSEVKLLQIFRPTNFNRPDPSKTGHRHRRIAARILFRRATSPITREQVSKEDYAKLQEDIAWAEQVIPNFSLELYGKERKLQKNDAKRQCPVEEHGNYSRASKRPKPHETELKSPAEVVNTMEVRDHRIIGVIDENNDDGKIPKYQWKWVQAALANVALKVLRENPGPPPSCIDAGWFQGSVKLTACENARTAELYKLAIAKVGEVYPGARLRAVEARDIPSRPRARGWFPAAPTNPDEIIAMLKEFNPTIPTYNWEIINIEKTNQATMQVVLLLNHKCRNALAKSDFTVDYGFDRIHLNIYEADTEAQVNLAAFTEPTDQPDLDHGNNNKDVSLVRNDDTSNSSFESRPDAVIYGGHEDMYYGAVTQQYPPY